MVVAVQPVARYQLYGTQDDFVADAARYVCFIGGRNSGKTYSGSIKALIRATQGGLGCIAAPSFPMLENGAKRQFLARLDESGITYDATRTGVRLPDYGSEVVFVTLESESRVRGPNYDWAWPDEIDYVADRRIWQALKGAVRSGDNPQIWATTTPKGRRLVYDEWVVNPTEHHRLYKATTYDNLFIDAADYVAGLGYEGVFYEQEINADFVSFEGLVYPGFDRAKNVRHLTADDLDGWATLLTMDVGTNNPTAILKLRHSGDRLHIESEFYRRGLSSDAITDAAVNLYAGSGADHMVIDPSSAGLILSLRARDVRVTKGINDIMIGIARVTSVIPNLTVDPSCVNFISEIEAYQYPDKKQGESDVPIKANDHTQDALRYGVMDIYGKPKPKVVGGVAGHQTSKWRG